MRSRDFGEIPLPLYILYQGGPKKWPNVLERSESQTAIEYSSKMGNGDSKIVSIDKYTYISAYDLLFVELFQAWSSVRFL